MPEPAVTPPQFEVEADSGISLPSGRFAATPPQLEADIATPLPGGRFNKEFTKPFEFLNPTGEKVVDPRAYRPSAPIDAIAPIYDPKFVAAGEIEMLDDELVMGVEIDGDARAYPVGMMRFREMVNDVVGGVPLLVTW